MKGTPVGVEPTLSTCCADPGAAAVSTSAATATCTKRLKSIVPSHKVWTPAGMFRLRQAIEGFAGQADFYNCGIMLTLPVIPQMDHRLFGFDFQTAKREAFEVTSPRLPLVMPREGGASSSVPSMNDSLEVEVLYPA